MTNLSISKLSAPTATQDQLDASAMAIFELFIERETEFATSEDVAIDYPDIAGSTQFLSDPLAYISARLEQAEGAQFGHVVILTTFANMVGEALERAGYAATRIDMPAGPDFTSAYHFKTGDGPRTLYIEAVNETDPKIRASFAMELRDGGSKLVGGACGSIHRRDGKAYAYLATMTLGAGLPSGTGTMLDEQLVAFLRELGVSTVDLGTQTAGPFYQRLGYRIAHTVLPKLRYRITADGNRAYTDLVMLRRDLA